MHEFFQAEDKKSGISTQVDRRNSGKASGELFFSFFFVLFFFFLLFSIQSIQSIQSTYSMHQLINQSSFQDHQLWFIQSIDLLLIGIGWFGDLNRIESLSESDYWSNSRLKSIEKYSKLTWNTNEFIHPIRWFWIQLDHWVDWFQV